MRPPSNLTLARATDAQLRAELKARGFLVITKRVVKPLKRDKPIAKRNAKRAAKTYERNFGTRAAVVRDMPCLVCRSIPSQAAHVRARGMGGAKGDRRDLVPLCPAHHRDAGEHRTSTRADFERHHIIDLDKEAEKIAAEMDARGYP